MSQSRVRGPIADLLTKQTRWLGGTKQQSLFPLVEVISLLSRWQLELTLAFSVLQLLRKHPIMKVSMKSNLEVVSNYLILLTKLSSPKKQVTKKETTKNRSTLHTIANTFCRQSDVPQHWSWWLSCWAGVSRSRPRRGPRWPTRSGSTSQLGARRLEGLRLDFSAKQFLRYIPIFQVEM